jgi:ABC-type dipeptide/oligopeptide/nickel transport system permease component
VHGLRSTAHAALVVLLAHAFAFLLIRALPDAAVVALGFDSTRAEVVAAFRAARTDRSYLESLAGVARLDFGTTLDGVPVRAELAQALAASLPRFLGAFGLLVAAVVLVPALAERRGWLVRGPLPFLAFLPPYVVPFVALGVTTAIALKAGIFPAPWITEAIITLTLALPVTALALEQAGRIMSRLLGTDHARTLIALGIPPRMQRQLLMVNLCYELLPSLQKLSVAALGVLLFVEPVFGTPGIGSTALRAIRRSDADLLLGIVVVFAAMTMMIGCLGLTLRRRLARIGA